MFDSDSSPQACPDEVAPEVGEGLDDVPAILAALRAGPMGYGLPVVVEARRYTRHAVGGPLWHALADAVAAGFVRVIPYAEANARGLEMTGWSFCEDIR